MIKVSLRSEVAIINEFSGNKEINGRLFLKVGRISNCFIKYSLNCIIKKIRLFESVCKNKSLRDPRAKKGKKVQLFSFSSGRTSKRD